MADRKSNAGRPKMIAAPLKIGMNVKSQLDQAAKDGDWRKFDAISATFIRVSCRLLDKAPILFKLDPGIVRIITDEVKLMRNYIAISDENSPEIEGKSGGNSPKIDEKSDGNTPEIEDKSARDPDSNRNKDNSPSPFSGNPISFQDEEDAFGDLWEVYPRKVGWNEARRAFHRAVAEEGVAPATILNAVMEQSRSEEWREKGGKYVPSLARWLDGARWNDRLSSPGEKNNAAPPAQGAPRYMTPQDLKEEWARQAAAEQSTAVGESGGETETEPKPNDNRKETDP